MKAYRIRNFSSEFENAESRKLRRLTWVALPTRQEGDGYTELMSGHENGCAHFGAWTAILQLAAKCSPRGALVRDLGGRFLAHDIASMSRITRVPAEVLREAIPRLVEIGWLEEIALSEIMSDLPLPPGEPGDHREKSKDTGQGRTGEDSTVQHQGGEESPPPTPPASPSPGDAPSGTPSAAQKRRLDLLVILKAHNVKLEMGTENIFQEWVDDSNGYRLDWIEHLLKTVRPRITLPSKLRAALKEHAERYKTWRAA